MASANRVTEEDVKTWMRPLIEEEGWLNYELKISGVTGKGDGYLGDVTFVQVATGKNTYDYVIKSSKKSDEMRKALPLREAFQNEIHYYNRVAEVLKDFLIEKKFPLNLYRIPKCYKTLVLENIEVLILEDMQTSGFELHDRSKAMDRAHVDEVIKCYGYLHGISYALRDQKPEVFQKLIDEFHFDWYKSVHDMYKDHKPKHYNTFIEYAKTQNENEAAAKVQAFQEGNQEDYNFANPEDPYSVFLHGDCWNNNFLFNYQDEDKSHPSKVCFLDFQLSRVASPVSDLSYFLFTCLAEEDVQHFDSICQLYYDTLCNTIRGLGSDPSVLIPLDVLEEHWKKYARIGLTMSPALLDLCSTKKEDAIDIAEMADAGKLDDAFENNSKNFYKYASRQMAYIKLSIDREFL